MWYKYPDYNQCYYKSGNTFNYNDLTNDTMTILSC